MVADTAVLTEHHWSLPFASDDIVGRSRTNIHRSCVQLSLHIRNHAHSRINPPGAPMVFSALQETDRDLRLKPPDHRNVRSTDLALCYARSEEVTTRSRRNEWLARASRLCQIYLLSDKMDIVTSDPLSIIIRRCGP